MLFCAQMTDNETIVIKGASQYSTYKGYATSLKFVADIKSKVPQDKNGTVLQSVLAMDAYHNTDVRLQFQMPLFQREILKSYCGFSLVSENQKNCHRKLGMWSIFGR